jgi:hypothetical protein
MKIRFELDASILYTIYYNFILQIFHNVYKVVPIS